ncbi:MAG: hypothetical protein ACP5L5_06180 [Vulcanisaeta sp.]|uniref:Uncharacterized protein n=1 Tax=Vulcanisaeta moutnovskia (strain 768-28) TaxID=985053 RepID=F0QUP6_VULM7|nr:hypothetical protein [Vulcanisaeta moutnovskia]ADY00707.1 hypothetical protein VMUT_0496 [Vulcanisaeta moutnovskia 768-28]
MKSSNDVSSIGLVPESLRVELRRLVNVEYDNVMSDMLAYIIIRGPVTLYRVSRETPYSISSIYKKAKYMVKNNLLTPMGLNGKSNGKHIYEVTVKGLLTCLAYKCLDDDIVLNKLKIRWNLRNYNNYRLVSILTVLPYIIKNENLRIIENIDTLMITALSALVNNTIINNKLIDEYTVTNVKNTSIYYLVSNIINSMSNNKKPDIILGNNSFLIGYYKNSKILYVYICRLCDKNCILTYASCDNHCPLIAELSKDMINLVK